MGEVLRAIGFAQAPAVLRVFDFVPIVGWLLHLVVAIWLIATGITAVRQSLDFDTGRAIMTMIVGWVVMVFIQAIYYGILDSMRLA